MRPIPTGFGSKERGSGCDSLGYMTDTGVVTDAAWEALSGVHLLALESNHDARMLQMGPYPYVIKQRIASARGHLSNDQAREALDNLAHENLARGGGHARFPGEQYLPAPARHLRGRHCRARPSHDGLCRLPKSPRDHWVAALQLHGVHAAAPQSLPKMYLLEADSSVV